MAKIGYARYFDKENRVESGVVEIGNLPEAGSSVAWFNIGDDHIGLTFEELTGKRIRVLPSGFSSNSGAIMSFALTEKDAVDKICAYYQARCDELAKQLLDEQVHVDALACFLDSKKKAE